MSTSPLHARRSGVDRRHLLRGVAGVAGLTALGASLTACGSDTGSAATGASAAPVATGPGPGGYKIDLGGYQGPELTAKPVTLRFMRQSYSPEVNDFFTGLYAKFTAAYPNITIKEELVPYGDLPTKLKVYVASGDAPDVMMGRNDFTPAYAAGKIALPLTGYFTDTYLTDIYAPLREAASADGNLYCLPWDNNVEVLLFNRDLFAKAKVAPPPETTSIDGGWTIEQMIDAMRALTKNLKATDSSLWAMAASTAGNGGPGSNYTQHESFWIRMMGDPAAARDSDEYKTWAGVSDDGFSVTGYVDSAGAIQGMKNYQTFFSEDLTPKGAVPDQLTAGTAALSMDSFSMANLYESAGGKPKFDWGVSPMPKGRTLFGCNASDSPIVWAGSKNPNEAVALVAYLCNDANRIGFARMWGSVPARTSLITQMQEYQGEKQQLAVALAKASSGVPRTVGYFDYFNAMNPAVKNIALGADPAATLHTTAKQIDDLLAKYR
ncbi:ABC transporter substrate-binding protein [Micromonospora haikouensis]|uniref:ABC transporter substrate-binding protein n=1 Tax=Micromonospora haikouensis TaxID=686309 RepID=UPI00379C62E5